MNGFKKINEINFFIYFEHKLKIHLQIVIAYTRIPCPGNIINLQMYGHYKNYIEHFNHHNSDRSIIQISHLVV